jgi:hypothetical protein
MSGMRKCAECSELFRIENDGPEPMLADGTFPRHECHRCDYLKQVLAGLKDIPGAKASFVIRGFGPVVFVVQPHEGHESHVLEVRWKDKERLVADVCEEESGEMLHDEVFFTPGQEEALGPLLDLL